MKHIAIVLFTVALLLAGVSPVWAASKTQRPTVLAVVATPQRLPAAGGTVRLVVRDKFATTCTITVVPKIARFPRTLPCATGRMVAIVKVPKNAAPHRQTVDVRIIAKGPGGRSPMRVALLSQAAGGPIGTTLDVHDWNGNTLAVTVTQIIDPVTGTNPTVGDRFLEVRLTLQDQGSAAISDDTTFDTTVIATDGKDYMADYNLACANFGDGEFTVSPGASESGCVVFQLPDAVNVKLVQFSFDSDFLDTAQWSV